MFDPWNLVTIGIVAIVLVAYRILDRDNRSLEKVKRYADKLRDDLAGYADLRAEDLKAYAIELDVHQKAAKEVLRRIQSVEESLNGRSDAIGAMAARIAEYDKALAELKTMSGRVDENLRIIHEESSFVDGVARTLKGTKDEIERLKASLPEIREGLGADARTMLDDLRDGFSGEVKSALDDALDAVESLRVKADQSAETVGSMHSAAAQAAEERYRAVASQLTDAFKRAREEGEKLEDATFRKLQEQIEARGAKLSEALETRFDSLRDQAREKVAETQGMLKSFKSEWKKESEALLEKSAAQALAASDRVMGRVEEAEALAVKAGSLYAERFDRIEAKALEAAQSVQAKFKEALKANQEELAARQADIRAAMKESLSASRADAAEAIAELKGILGGFKSEADRTEAEQAARMAAIASSVIAAEKKAAEAIAALDGRLAERGSDLERRVLDGFERRAVELRGLVEQGLERLESVRFDADRMEKALRDSMAGIERRVEEDFSLFGKDLVARQAAFEAEFRGESARVKSSVQDLENDLNALKTRAYSNVSEKLKVFEDEFFADLRKRREDADERFASWRAELEEKLAASQREAAESRAETERAWGEESRAALLATQARAQDQLDKLAAQVAAHRDAITERVGEADGALAALKAAVKSDLDEARAAADAYLNAELGRWKHESAERLKGAERAASADALALEKAAAEARTRFEEARAAIMADTAKWKDSFVAAQKAAETARIAAVGTLADSFKADAAAIAADWDKERGRVLEAAKAERDALSRDLRALTDDVGKFRQEFAQKTSQALDDFSRSYDGLSADAARKVKDATAAMDAAIEEYRRESRLLKEGFDSARTAMASGLGEERKAREAAFAEIDRQVKAFQSQTKLFERADELKRGLAEAIESMKADMARAESRRAEMAELETQYGRVKRLEDELAQKIARFFAEKRRIDTLEDDFKRLLSLSQSVDQKLATVTAGNDQLAQIQAEMRRLSEAADEAAEKFERVERKSNILDATADAVDKNFQAITELERNVRTMDADIRDVPDRVIELKRSLEEVLSARPAMDAAVARLAEMEKSMADAEKRAVDLNKAREWLARAETRFEELNKKTQDHLKLLNDLLKDEPSTGRKDKGAPSLSVQETVRKLAHQGWKVEEIARAVKLSRGEVELILELGHQE